MIQHSFTIQDTRDLNRPLNTTHLNDPFLQAELSSPTHLPDYRLLEGRNDTLTTSSVWHVASSKLGIS